MNMYMLFPKEMRKNMTKIKFDIGSNEIVNCYARVVNHGDHYELFFDDGISYDSFAKFDSKRRCFYGAD